MGNYLESQQAEATPVTRTGRHGGEGDGERCSGIFVFCESVEDLVGQAITRDDNNCIVVQRDLPRDPRRVFPVRGDCG